MRHFRDRLRDAGRDVHYYQVESIAEGLDQYFATNPEDELVAMRPVAHGSARRIQELVNEAGGELRSVENAKFLCSRERFDTWAIDRERPYRQE